MHERKEYPLITADAFDARVVITADGKIANDGVRNPYPNPDYARAHAESLMSAADYLDM